MSDEKTLLICYNRGCGQKFDPNTNKEGINHVHMSQAQVFFRIIVVF